MKPSNESSFEECLAGYAMGELSEEELRQVGNASQIDGSKTLRDLERIAAAISLAGLEQTEDLPAHLRTAISAKGRSLVAVASGGQVLKVARTQPKQSTKAREILAWLACLAASVLAFFFWYSGAEKPDNLLAKAMTRDSLIATASDLIRSDWEKGTTPLKNEVSGDIVWSATAQSGFMRFVGLPANDPAVFQYQLWIYDPSRDSEPVDGGVFDIKSPGEAIVAIKAKLPVNRPFAFAVTIEQPGGVVVSDLSRLPLLSFVKSNEKKRPVLPEI